MENAIKWKADFQRDPIIKLSFIKITVISMLNFASLNVAISCQKSNPRLINSDYIYPISYKIAKKANPAKRICLN